MVIFYVRSVSRELSVLSPQIVAMYESVHVYRNLLIERRKHVAVRVECQIHAAVSKKPLHDAGVSTDAQQIRGAEGSTD